MVRPRRGQRHNWTLEDYRLIASLDDFCLAVTKQVFFPKADIYLALHDPHDKVEEAIPHAQILRTLNLTERKNYEREMKRLLIGHASLRRPDCNTDDETEVGMVIDAIVDMWTRAMFSDDIKPAVFGKQVTFVSKAKFTKVKNVFTKEYQDGKKVRGGKAAHLLGLEDISLTNASVMFFDGEEFDELFVCTTKGNGSELWLGPFRLSRFGEMRGCPSCCNLGHEDYMESERPAGWPALAIRQRIKASKDIEIGDLLVGFHRSADSCPCRIQTPGAKGDAQRQSEANERPAPPSPTAPQATKKKAAASRSRKAPARVPDAGPSTFSQPVPARQASPPQPLPAHPESPLQPPAVRRHPQLAPPRRASSPPAALPAGVPRASPPLAGPSRASPPAVPPARNDSSLSANSARPASSLSPDSERHVTQTSPATSKRNSPQPSAPMDSSSPLSKIPTHSASPPPSAPTRLASPSRHSPARSATPTTPTQAARHKERVSDVFQRAYYSGSEEEYDGDTRGEEDEGQLEYEDALEDQPNQSSLSNPSATQTGEAEPSWGEDEIDELAAEDEQDELMDDEMEEGNTTSYPDPDDESDIPTPPTYKQSTPPPPRKRKHSQQEPVNPPGWQPRRLPSRDGDFAAAAEEPSLPAEASPSSPKRRRLSQSQRAQSEAPSWHGEDLQVGRQSIKGDSVKPERSSVPLVPLPRSNPSFSPPPQAGPSRGGNATDVNHHSDRFVSSRSYSGGTVRYIPSRRDDDIDMSERDGNDGSDDNAEFSRRDSNGRYHRGDYSYDASMEAGSRHDIHQEGSRYGNHSHDGHYPDAVGRYGNQHTRGPYTSYYADNRHAHYTDDRYANYAEPSADGHGAAINHAHPAATQGQSVALSNERAHQPMRLSLPVYGASHLPTPQFSDRGLDVHESAGRHDRAACAKCDNLEGMIANLRDMAAHDKRRNWEYLQSVQRKIVELGLRYDEWRHDYRDLGDRYLDLGERCNQLRRMIDHLATRFDPR